LNHRHSHTLLVLTGPVGVGKSTTASAAARQLRGFGLAVACIDLDQIYCMIRQREGFDDQDTWRMARQSAAALADHFFNRVASIVIVEGGFLTQEEQDELIEALPSKPHTEFVTLHASFDTVHARVIADSDPGRVASKVPAILKELYVEYEAALPFLRETTKCIQVDNCSVEQVATHISVLVKGSAGGGHLDCDPPRWVLPIAR
jgi:shikimate kinase